MNKTASRGTDIDIQSCTEIAGGNRFNLILMASIRARELAKKYKDEENGKQGAPITALLEIQDGRIGQEYLKKVK